MFIAMNRFQVAEGQGERFEQIWRERESHLDGVPGFVRFALLRGDQGAYISHSTWESRDAFMAWTQSPAFSAGHRGGPSMADILVGPPEVSTWEAVVQQERATV